MISPGQDQESLPPPYSSLHDDNRTNLDRITSTLNDPFLKEGDRIGKYTIMKPLSQSHVNHTAIFSVKNRLGQLFAAKVSFHDNDNSYRTTRLSHEVDMISLLYTKSTEMNLDTNSFVRLFDEDVNGSPPYMIMEQYDITLRDWAERKRNHCSTTDEYLLQIQSVVLGQLIPSLEHLQACGIVHGDIKAENFMAKMIPDIGPGPWILIDFDASHKVTDTVESPRCTYFPPEYCLAHEIKQSVSMTSAIDWWCLGCLVADLLSSFQFWDRCCQQDDFTWAQNGLNASYFSESIPSDVRDTLLKYLLQNEPTKRSLSQFKGSSIFQTRKTGHFTKEFRRIHEQFEKLDVHVNQAREELATVHTKVDQVQNSINHITAGMDALQHNLSLLAHETVPHHFVIVPPSKRGLFVKTYRIHFGCEAPGHEHFLKEATYERKVPGDVGKVLFPLAKFALGAALKWTAGCSFDFVKDLFPFVPRLEISERQIESVMGMFDEWFVSQFDGEHIPPMEATRHGIEWIKGIIQEDKNGKLNIHFENIGGKYYWVCQQHRVGTAAPAGISASHNGRLEQRPVHEIKAYQISDPKDVKIEPVQTRPGVHESNSLKSVEKDHQPKSSSADTLPVTRVDTLQIQPSKPKASLTEEPRSGKETKADKLNNNHEVKSTALELVDASMKGDFSRVSELIQQGADVNAQDKFGATALMRAAFKGHIEIIKQLLEHGADTNMEDRNGWTALKHAASGGHTDAGRLLLDNGADVNSRDKSGSRALMNAASGGFGDFVQLLIDHGADVNAQSDVGSTGLICAASQGHTDIVRVLLDHGAGVNALLNYHEWTALMIASSKGYLDIVKLVLDRDANVNVRDKVGETALISAAKKGYADIVTLLLDHGAKVNIQDDSGSTALLYAASSGCTDVVKLLLLHGADVNIRDKKGGSPLISASRMGYTEIVRLLLQHDANVHFTLADGSTALFHAASGNHMDIIKLLIAHGANFNEKDKYNLTHLMRAARDGDTEMVQYILQKGADPNLTVEKEKTPLYYAVKMGHKNVVQLLLANGTKLHGRSTFMGGKKCLELQWTEDQEIRELIQTHWKSYY